MDAALRREKRRVCFIKCKDKGFISIEVVFASDCFSFFVLYVRLWKMCDLSCEFSLLSSRDSLLFHFGLESMSPYFLANLARFRRKGVRFLSPVALFVSAVVRAAAITRLSPSRAYYAHSASFCLSAFTSSPFAYNRLIYRWLRVKGFTAQTYVEILCNHLSHSVLCVKAKGGFSPLAFTLRAAVARDILHRRFCRAADRPQGTPR